jgi:hypothetical protein
MDFYNLKANGVSLVGWKEAKYRRKGKKILSYYVVDNAALELSFTLDASTKLDMELLESSFDLLENNQFAVPKRQNWMMPTPFVLNDAVVIRQTIKPTVFIPIATVDAKKAVTNIFRLNTKPNRFKPITVVDSTVISIPKSNASN